MTADRFPPRRIVGGVIGDLRWGDVDPGVATVAPHAYLDCWHCGDGLYVGGTDNGATVFICCNCALIADVRRVL
jgi:hypothetical protein